VLSPSATEDGHKWRPQAEKTEKGTVPTMNVWSLVSRGYVSRVPLGHARSTGISRGGADLMEVRTMVMVMAVVRAETC
jgi:hypothetical protein